MQVFGKWDYGAMGAQMLCKHKVVSSNLTSSTKWVIGSSPF